MKVHRISPLNEETMGLRNPGAGKQPAVALGGQQQRSTLQACPSVPLPSEPTPLLFQLEDVPSPIQRVSSGIATAFPAAGQSQATIETLRLLLGPASEGEAMVRLCQRRCLHACHSVPVACGLCFA